MNHSNLNLNTSRACDEISQYGCSAQGPFRIQNFYTTILLALLATFTLASNTIILIFYIRYNSTWTFLQASIVEYLIHNKISSLVCFMIVTSGCFEYFTRNRYLCTLLFCLVNFAMIYTFKVRPDLI